MKTHHKVILIALGGVVAYVVYRNYFASNAGAGANQNMGGIDFGILDPSSW